MGKKRKRDANWMPIKLRLLDDFGNMCWLCKRRFPRSLLTIHHVHAFKDTHRTEYKDSMILCQNCHYNIVNKIDYNSNDYWCLMEHIAETMQRMFDVDINFKK